MRKSLTLLLLLALSGVTAAQNVDDPLKAVVEDKIRRDCLESNNRAIENATIPDSVVERFCICVAQQAREVVTSRDITLTGPTREFQTKLNGIAVACMRESLIFR
jgi:histone H3/H4